MSTRVLTKGHVKLLFIYSPVTPLGQHGWSYFLYHKGTIISSCYNCIDLPSGATNEQLLKKLKKHPKLTSEGYRHVSSLF